MKDDKEFKKLLSEMEIRFRKEENADIQEKKEKK
jgi:hypothetical protein